MWCMVACGCRQREHEQEDAHAVQQQRKSSNHQQPLSLLSAQPLSGQGEKIEQGSFTTYHFGRQPSASPDKARIGGKSGPREWALAIGWIIGDTAMRRSICGMQLAGQSSRPMMTGAGDASAWGDGWRRLRETCVLYIIRWGISGKRVFSQIRFRAPTKESKSVDVAVRSRLGYAYWPSS
jgi:hypothetical protein